MNKPNVLKLAFLLCAAACSVGTGTLLAFLGAEGPSNVSQRTLTFAERVAYQSAIEDVYWRHRIWPDTNPGPKPPLDKVMSQAEIEKKVEDYLRNSQALEDYWLRPITPDQLQAEMERMASHTKQPEVLQELFEALGNDPFVIAECLARPVLAERLANGDPVMAGVVATPLRGVARNVPQARGYSERHSAQLTVTMAAVSSANYTLPVIAGPSGGCIDAWGATSTVNAPTARDSHTAVWTGSEMIVWGGASSGGYLNTGGRYNPSTDSWVATTTTGAPAARYLHTAVWTGSEMIVWGGSDNNGTTVFNTGGRYNPSTNSWTATSIINAPEARAGHTAVWTGTQMIVWGGFFRDLVPHNLNTGGKYNPSTDSWTATSTANVPAARTGHRAVWTGSEMIVWGGYNGSSLNTGGRYNPGTNAWTATTLTNAPAARISHTAVWSTSEMIVWGGFDSTNYFNTGGRYNPSTNSWTATTTVNAPTARDSHTAVWTGSEMIVWGGASSGGYLNTGGKYCAVPPVVITNPATKVAAYSATLNGSVSPGGLTTSVHFQYGTTTSYGLNTANQSFSGSTTQSVAANISGLSASTTYHFRIVGTNSSGTYYGADRTFTTLSAIGPPVVTTNPATLIASFSATLNGTVDPHGLTTTVYFQYGKTTSYGLTTAVQSKSGNTYQNVAANIGSLSASTTYHFRIVAVNNAGTVYGADRTFTTLSATGAPVVITNPATNVASSSATLNGTVDPHGLTTAVYFQYGKTTSYGLTTAVQSKSGNTYQNVAANIGSLSASTTYHFRIVATNSAGTRYGGDRAFTTTP